MGIPSTYPGTSPFKRGFPKGSHGDIVLCCVGVSVFCVGMCCVVLCDIGVSVLCWSVV